MADWAYYVALFSGLGLIISLGGVGLIYATFVKTGEAVETARKANEIAFGAVGRQLRAYIELEKGFIVLGDQPSGGAGSCHIQAQIINTGSTPALKVIPSVMFRVSYGDTVIEVAGKADRDQTFDIRKDGPANVNLSAADSLDGWNKEIDATARACLRLDYVDAFGTDQVDEFWLERVYDSKGAARDFALANRIPPPKD